MASTEERAARYLKGGMSLTPKQRKRLLKKDRKATIREHNRMVEKFQDEFDAEVVSEQEER